MILETIVTTQDSEGRTHIAPMGIHAEPQGFLIMPFKPSTTLQNLLETKTAVINYCDDVRVFAGCLTGRKNWPLTDAQVISGKRLTNALAHCEVELVKVEDDDIRPKLTCKSLLTVNHQAFTGFNRAQFAVLEAAILISRLGMLPWEKVESEIAYLRIALEKTAGEREWEAWEWLMAVLDDVKRQAGL